MKILIKSTLKDIERITEVKEYRLTYAYHVLIYPWYTELLPMALYDITIL